MERVSIGYLFSLDRNYVALIGQQFQEDNIHISESGIYLNGIGGHIEIGESSHDAIVREFKEEAGLNIPDWKLVANLYRNGLQVDFYKAFSDEVFDVKTMEEETVSVFNIEQLKYLITHPNLNILVSMSLDDKLNIATLVY